MGIEFEYSSKEYQILDEGIIRKWIIQILEIENRQVGEISYKFVTEEEILEINKDFLNHDYFTDIITFDNCFVNIINGDIIVSLDTIKSNSKRFQLNYKTEIFRVIIHGIMHLCGHKDSTKDQKILMRDLEDKYLSYLEKL